MPWLISETFHTKEIKHGHSSSLQIMMLLKAEQQSPTEKLAVRFQKWETKHWEHLPIIFMHYYLVVSQSIWTCRCRRQNTVFTQCVFAVTEDKDQHFPETAMVTTTLLLMEKLSKIRCFFGAGKKARCVAPWPSTRSVTSGPVQRLCQYICCTGPLPCFPLLRAEEQGCCQLKVGVFCHCQCAYTLNSDMMY